MLVLQNQTQEERMKNNFLCERAVYLFEDRKLGRRINVHQNTKDKIYNFNMMIGEGKSF